MIGPEIKRVPQTVLTLVLSVTGAASPESTFIRTLLPPPIQGSSTAAKGALTPPALLSDTLAGRYDGARLAPYEASRRHLHQLLLDARRLCSEWSEPALNLGMDGQLELQWWHGEKSLTLIIDGDRASYLLAWGEDIHSQMEDGDLEGADAFVELWAWLSE